VARVLNVILTHQPPAAVARMVAWWSRFVDPAQMLIAAGGSRADFAAIAHPQKVFIEDPRLHTVDHQREFQSYTGAFAAVAKWLAGRAETHVSWCEFDHLPLDAGFNVRQLARLEEERADVLGLHVHRVDGTNHPHYLYHQHNPDFHEYWARITQREDSEVILSMFGSGSFWTREAFEAVAASTEPFRVYLEIYLPTLAHHLGFRVRDVPEQNEFVQVRPAFDEVVDDMRAAGAWAAHPVKRRWLDPGPARSPSATNPRRASPSRRIVWLPAHPAEGTLSMLRHWRELEEAFQAAQAPDLEATSALGRAPGPRPRAHRLVRAWHKYLAYPRLVGQLQGVDVLHILDHSFAHLLRHAPAGARKIVTVHDIAPLADHTLTLAQERRFRRTLTWLNHADLLLCDSAYTAARVRELVGAGPRLEVLLLGVNTHAFGVPIPFTAPLPLPAGPRLLSVGSVIPRKNLGAFPAILRRIVEQCGPVSLLRVGELLPAPLRAEIEAALGGGQLAELGRVSDTELISIYQASDILVFPSTLEGFGLPLVEAMAAGCAVVSSRASSLPEVGGEAALYFDPAEPGEAAAHVVDILQQPPLRAALVERGRLRARELSWESHREKLTAIYRRLAGE